MSIMSSPRRRRRLAWLVGSVSVLAVIVGVLSLIPNQSGSGRTGPPPPPPDFGQQAQGPGTTPRFGSTPAEERAARRSEQAVRPLAQRFVDDLSLRRNLPEAYAMLTPSLQDHYSLASWRQGRDLPLSATGGSGGVSIAFSGATTVGVVADFGAERLFAVRFEKANARWRVDYVHQGQGSRYVDSSNFAPAGFVPGSRHETGWTWFALIGGVLALVAVAVVVERRLAPKTR